jgi:hypothetical protein
MLSDLLAKTLRLKKWIIQLGIPRGDLLSPQKQLENIHHRRILTV